MPSDRYDLRGGTTIRRPTRACSILSTTKMTDSGDHGSRWSAIRGRLLLGEGVHAQTQCSFSVEPGTGFAIQYTDGAELVSMPGQSWLIDRRVAVYWGSGSISLPSELGIMLRPPVGLVETIASRLTDRYEFDDSLGVIRRARGPGGLLTLEISDINAREIGPDIGPWRGPTSLQIDLATAVVNCDESGEVLGSFITAYLSDDHAELYSEDGPLELDQASAISWAQSRAATVLVSVGDRRFSAGRSRAVPVEQYEIWPPR